MTKRDTTLGEINARQAEALRRTFDSATFENPITLSPSLYDRLRPEDRGRYIRGSRS